ncbi:hypothetical protein B0H13DRAFT_2649462 [Mycena leptocephala]|nr:hypothetical protein B0H13DRAFT_2649462 [Mycena leptocephala]
MEDITAAVLAATHARLAHRAAPETLRRALNPAPPTPATVTAARQATIFIALYPAQSATTLIYNSSTHLAMANRTTTSFCYYNPANEAQVLFDVSFTKWKWAITAVFGMLPLLITLGLFAYFLLVLPLWNLVKVGLKDMAYANRAKTILARLKAKRTPRSNTDPDVLENPPPAYKAEENGN